MSSGVNKVILIGNVGREIEVKYTQSGKAVAQLSLATNENWFDKQSNEWQKRAEWHTVVLWDKLAENAAQYLHKGSKIYVEGRLQTRKYGQDNFKTEVVANVLQYLDSKNANGGQQQYAAAQSQYAAPPPPAQHQAAPPPAQQHQAAPPPQGEDMPF